MKEFDKLVESVLTEGDTQLSSIYKSFDDMLKKSKKLDPKGFTKLIDEKGYSSNSRFNIIRLWLNEGRSYMDQLTHGKKGSYGFIVNFAWDDPETGFYNDVYQFTERFATDYSRKRDNNTSRTRNDPNIEEEEIVNSQVWKKYTKSLKKQFPDAKIIFENGHNNVKI